MQTYETEKYPLNIQRLFTPKVPLRYVAPIDHEPELRKTMNITGISSWKTSISDHIQHINEHNNTSKETTKNKDQIVLKNRLEKKKSQNESFQRQLKAWNDPDSFNMEGEDFTSDPYRTIFIARLDYSLRELDISKNFSRYGAIESVRIIRNKVTGKSRGYGFILFERENDAKSCVRELASTGLKIPTPDSSKTRTILIDIERGRTIRNWKPRRLSGGLGGRHYTKPNPRFSNNASAAASGRQFSHYNSSYSHSNVSNTTSNWTYGARYGSHKYRDDSQRDPPQNLDQKQPEQRESLKSKYSKYSTADAHSQSSLETSYRSFSTQDRSIRNIRQRTT